MNWTGGNLSRTRNANTSITAKQKNHFAKARAKLQSAPSFTPKIHTFDFGPWQPECEVGHSTFTKQQGILQRQTILDDFENTGPVVRKLESLKPRGEKRKSRQLEQVNPHTKHKITTGRSASPVFISSRPSSSSSFQSSHKATVTPVQPTASSSSDAHFYTSIESKRRRLLQMQDWVGVEQKHSKPAHVQFTDAKDRDMIGRRRQIQKSNSDSQPVSYQPIRRKKFPEEARGLASPDQYFSAGQMSIRIGSAVDKRRYTPISDEMLFGSEFAKPIQRASPVVPTVMSGELGHLPLSERTHRELRTPSASADQHSSSSSAFTPVPPQRRYEDQSGTLRFDAQFDIGDDFETNPQFERAEPEPSYVEPDAVQEEPRLRLVFENTPQPYVHSSETRISSPIIRSFALAGEQSPVAKQKKSGFSKGQKAGTVKGQNVVNDLSSDGLVFSISPLANATSQNVKEPQRCGTNGAEWGNISGSKANNAATSPTKHTEKDFNPKTLSADDPNLHVTTYAKELGLNKSSTTPEEESMWRSLTMVDDMEDVRSPKARPVPNSIVREPAASPPLSTFKALPPNPQNEISNATEEEEQIWRNFIFSSSDSNNNWAIEELPSSPRPQSPYDPSRTQPSMIAEAATSPIKQNPHIDAFEAIPAESTASPNESFPCAGTQAPSSFIADAHNATYPPSDLAEVSPSTEDPVELLEESPATKQTFVFKPWGTRTTITKLPKPSVQESDLPSPIAQPSSSLQKLPSRKSDPPSLIAEASSASVQASSNPINISSDELHGPPPGPVPRLRSKLNEAKVVFTPPKRYVGKRATDPPPPVQLGSRVLRNGKRLSDEPATRMRKGKGKAKAGQLTRLEHDDDNIEDDLM